MLAAGPGGMILPPEWVLPIEVIGLSLLGTAALFGLAWLFKFPHGGPR